MDAHTEQQDQGLSIRFWVGVILLLISALVWLFIILVIVATVITDEPEDRSLILPLVIIGVAITAIPIGYGIYNLRHGRKGRKARAVEIRLGAKPRYPTQPSARYMPEMKPDAERAYPTKVTVTSAQTHGRFFSRLRERLRDKTRDKLCDKLCDDLCAMGLDARMVERRRREEKMILGLESSLGLVEIRDSPIRYENVRKHIRDQYGSYDYKNVYLVPDTRVPKGGYLQLKSVQVQTKSVFGRVVDLRWEAKFVKVGIKSMPVLTGVSVPVKMDSNLIRRVSEDISVKETLIGLNEDITIRSLEDWGWAISTSATHERQPAPSRKQWDCYETIARHLLEAEEGELI